MASIRVMVRLLHNAAFMHNDFDARIAANSAAYRLGGVRIVGVASDEDPQVTLRPRCQGMRHRKLDDLRFLPGRNKNRGAARERPCRQRRARDFLRLGPAGEFQLNPGEIDGELVERAPEKERSSEKQQLVLNEREPLDQ